MQFKKIVVSVILILTFLILPYSALAEGVDEVKHRTTEDIYQSGEAESTKNENEGIKKVELNIPTLTLKLKQGSTTLKEYTVAVGKTFYQTPIGKYSIKNKIIYPTWYPAGREPVPPGSQNPLGTRWLGIHNGYGIHGNNNPESIGTFISKGCIRLYNKDVEELFDLVEIGTPVEITYETILLKKDEYTQTNYLEVYPDVYNLGINIKERIMSILKENSIAVSEHKLNNLLNQINKTKVIFSATPVLQINGHTLTNDVVASNNKYYVNFMAVSRYLRLDTNLDKDLQRIYLKKIPVAFCSENDKQYIAVDDIAEILNSKAVVDEECDLININAYYMVVNDKFLTSNVIVFQGKPLVGLRELSEFFNVDVFWDEESRKIFLEGKEIDARLIQQKAYINLNEAEKLFDVDAHWNKNRGVVKLARYRGFINGETGIPRLVVKGGLYPLIPIRFVGEYFGYAVGWNGKNAVVNGREVKTALINGKSYALASELKEIMYIDIDWKPETGILNITKQSRQ